MNGNETGRHQPPQLPMRTEPIEITARRGRIGLSLIKFSEWLPWKQSRTNEAERGAREFPAWAEERLTEAEDLFDQIAETLYEDGLRQLGNGAQVAIVPTYRQDRAFWKDFLDYQPLPACVHQAAAAEARAMLIDEGHLARIVQADEETR